MAYAHKTKVPSDRTRVEIEQVLRRYGADYFRSEHDLDMAAITFRVKGRYVKFTLPLPTERQIKARERREQQTRARWRALLLAIKAKLTIVESGIASFETEFLANIVVNDGKTIADHIVHQLDAITSGDKLLPPAGDA